jgi:hypothetical protein
MNYAELYDAWGDKYNYYRNLYYKERGWRDEMGYPYIEDNHIDYNVYKNYYKGPFQPSTFNKFMMNKYDPRNMRRLYHNVQPFNI